MPPLISAEHCNKCGTCAQICPMNIFEQEKKAVPVVKYPEECWHCNACVLDCPADAIELRIPLNYALLHTSVESFNATEKK